jgi:hypothetical protein
MLFAFDKVTDSVNKGNRHFEPLKDLPSGAYFHSRARATAGRKGAKCRSGVVGAPLSDSASCPSSLLPRGLRHGSDVLGKPESIMHSGVVAHMTDPNAASNRLWPVDPS